MDEDTTVSTECPRCAGCGQISNAQEGEDGEPWSEVLALLARSPESPMHTSVRLGWVRPLPCPDCHGLGKATDELPCPHDWRVDPSIVYTSNPAQQRLVCATCGASRSRPIPNATASPDVTTWEKA